MMTPAPYSLCFSRMTKSSTQETSITPATASIWAASAATTRVRPCARGDFGACACDLVGDKIGVGARLEAHPIELRAAAREVRVKLVRGMKEADPDDRVERLDVARRGRRHARLEGEVRQIAAQLGAERFRGRAPRRLDRAGELHDVIAVFALRVLGDRQAGRNIRPLAMGRRKRRGAQLDRRRVRRTRRNDLLRRCGQRQRRKQYGYGQADIEFAMHLDYSGGTHRSPIWPAQPRDDTSTRHRESRSERVKRRALYSLNRAPT